MDGLLIDSEVLWHQAELEILGGLGVPIPTEHSRATKGMYVDEVVATWFARAPWEGPSQAEVVAALLDRVGELATERDVLLPGVREALALVEAEGLDRALASSTPHALIERILRHYDLRESFRFVCSAQDEPYGKPHPAVFLTAAQRLGVAPSTCVVFEDAPAGILAAKSARMACVAVPEAAERDHRVVGIADVVLTSLTELTSAVLEGLDVDR